MKSFQPKAPPPEAEGPDEDPGDEDPGAPPPSRAPDATKAKPDPMIRCPAAPARTAMPRSFGHSLGPMAFAPSLRGEKRSNATHASRTDPEARLYKKSPGTGAMLCFIGHALMDEAGVATGPRHPPQGSGLIVQGELSPAPLAMPNGRPRST